MPHMLVHEIIVPLLVLICADLISQWRKRIAEELREPTAKDVWRFGWRLVLNIVGLSVSTFGTFWACTHRTFFNGILATLNILGIMGYCISLGFNWHIFMLHRMRRRLVADIQASLNRLPDDALDDARPDDLMRELDEMESEVRQSVSEYECEIKQLRRRRNSHSADAEYAAKVDEIIKALKRMVDEEFPRQRYKLQAAKSTGIDLERQRQSLARDLNESLAEALSLGEQYR